jgi:CRISPR-associated protein Csy1
MNTKMDDALTKRIQKTIKEYIDDIGEEKIADRTLDKLDRLHKDFLANLFDQLKPLYKEFDEIKIKVEKAKKEKAPKSSTKLEKIDFTKRVIDELTCLVKNYRVLNEVLDSYKHFLEQVRFIESWNQYEQWIDWTLDFGEGSCLATHIAKLSHSSSKGSSIDVRYFDSCGKYSSHFIYTNKQPTLDTAYPDNKYSSISQLYNIKVDGVYIGDLLRENGSEYLNLFTKNKDLLDFWSNKFSELITNKSKHSYFLSKQIYFPVSGRQYHLLLPLTSSSLVHTLHLEKKNTEDIQKSARRQKKLKKYSATITRAYPGKAYLHVTGSNHSNASSLNGQRGGRIALFPSMPPQWRTRLISYVSKTSLFDKTLAYELKDEINELKNYLLLMKSKSLSISEPQRNAAVINKLQDISGQFFNYLEKINANEGSHGWTVNSKLPIEEQLAFEPWRKDEVAQAKKISNEWQKVFSQNYGRWLNQQLATKSKLNPTAIHAALWADCFLNELREMDATQEVAL